MNIQSQNRTNLTRGSDFDESLARSHEYLLKDMRAEADFIQKKLLQSQPQTPPNETLFSSSSSNVPHSIDRSKLPNLPPALLNIFKISWSPSMQKDMDQAFTTYWQRFQSFCTTMHTDVLDQDAYFIRWLKLILHPRDQSIVDEHIARKTKWADFVPIFEKTFTPPGRFRRDFFAFQKTQFCAGDEPFSAYEARYIKTFLSVHPRTTCVAEMDGIMDISHHFLKSLPLALQRDILKDFDTYRQKLNRESPPKTISQARANLVMAGASSSSSSFSSASKTVQLDIEFDDISFTEICAAAERLINEANRDAYLFTANEPRSQKYKEAYPTFGQLSLHDSFRRSYTNDHDSDETPGFTPQVHQRISRQDHQSRGRERNRSLSRDSFRPTGVTSPLAQRTSFSGIPCDHKSHAGQKIFYTRDECINSGAAPRQGTSTRQPPAADLISSSDSTINAKRGGPNSNGHTFYLRHGPRTFRTLAFTG